MSGAAKTAYDATQDSAWLLGKLIELILADCPVDGSGELFAEWGVVAYLTGLLGLSENLPTGDTPEPARVEKRRRIAAWLDENRERLGL